MSMPPSIAFLDAAELLSSGSPLYRVHRPAAVLGHKFDWLTFVTPRHQPPEKPGKPWMIEVEGIPMCPQVLVLRPTMLATLYDDEKSPGERWEGMRRHVEDAQKAGQIVLLDLDDHPYAWNEFQIREGHPERAFDVETWQAHDAYVAQFNTVLCSTRKLVEVMETRFRGPENRTWSWPRFEYAPNLYDPWRYHPERARFGKVLGSHLYVKARDFEDFRVLGEAVNPLLEADPDLMFMHIGEEFECGVCKHRRDEHFEEGPCDHCRCEEYIDGAYRLGYQLTRAAGIPRDRIIPDPPCSPWELPEHLTYNVGIVPMADSEWNHCKTEGKGFEMAAAGIPFVAYTGSHPLYRGTEIDRLFENSINYWCKLESAWEQGSKQARRWAEQIAQEHERDYLATLKRLSESNLHK